MANIKVFFREYDQDDNPRYVLFEHAGRPGGSYTKTIRYEGNFAIIKDEWGKEIAYPSDAIDHIEVTLTRMGIWAV